MFVTEVRYTVIEHDPSRPWIVVGEAQHRVIELPSIDDFGAWARQQWPPDRYTVQLAPGQEEPHLRY
jgi:hypothetical protein